MKTARLKKYGSPDNFEIQDTAKPTPGDGEVLVRIHASSVNDWDWSITMGSPFYIRLLCGLFRPKIATPGVDIAGIIEAVGNGVTTFKQGDAVYGDLSESGFGGFAEYVCVPETLLASKPVSIDFSSAAAIPHAGTLALQGLRLSGDLKPPSKILINGAGGGVGTIGLQIAKALGTKHVTGVDHQDKLRAMSALGFDAVIDYTQTDFTTAGKTYDLILDTKTNRSPLKFLKALNPGGTYVTVGGNIFRLLQTFLMSPLVSLFSRKRIRLLALKTNQDLDFIRGLIDSGKIVPVTDGPTPLSELPQAIKRFGESRHVGKIIIAIAPEENPGSREDQ